MNDRKVLLATRGPLSTDWRLAKPGDGLPLLLLGWRIAPELEREGGMPESVAALLADALLQVGALSYPASSAQPLVADARTSLVTGRSAGERFRALLSRAPTSIRLVTTTSSSLATRLFDDPGFPWWLQGQIALVSAAGSVPDVDRAALLQLMDPMRPVRRADFSTLSLKAVVRPGVSGDVAALLSDSADTDAAVVAAIESSARKAGFQCRTLPEAQFARALGEDRAAASGTTWPELPPVRPGNRNRR